MSIVSIEEAQAKLSELIDQLDPGEEMLITRNNQSVAKLVGQKKTERLPRGPGNCKGMITLLVEDDEHLKDFEEYMP